MSIRIKRKIKKLEEKHRLIEDNLIDAIWSVDADTLKFDYITASIQKLSGYSADEYRNLSIKERMTPDSFNKVATILAEEIPKFEKGEKVIRKLDLEFYHKSGGTYWAEIKARFIKEPRKPLKIVGVSSDINARKLAEQEQKNLLHKLGKALAEKEKLLKEVKILRGLLPICSGCKRIRDENGKWWPLDAYVDAHTDADITHTICDGCQHVLYAHA
jgi:PAS domain S-box-containing protein